MIDRNSRGRRRQFSGSPAYRPGLADRDRMRRSGGTGDEGSIAGWPCPSTRPVQSRQDSWSPHERSGPPRSRVLARDEHRPRRRGSPVRSGPARSRPVAAAGRRAIVRMRGVVPRAGNGPRTAHRARRPSSDPVMTSGRRISAEEPAEGWDQAIGPPQDGARRDGMSGEPIGSADRAGRPGGTGRKAGHRRRGGRSGASRPDASEQTSPGTPSWSPRGIGIGAGAAAGGPGVGQSRAHEPQAASEDARFEQSGVSPWIAIATRRIQYPARVDRLSMPITTVPPSRRKDAPRILSGSPALSPQFAVWRGQLDQKSGRFSINDCERTGPCRRIDREAATRQVPARLQSFT